MSEATYHFNDEFRVIQNGNPPLELLSGITAAFDLSGQDLPGVSKYLEVDASTLLNLRVGFRTAHGVDVSLYARNAFDEDYLSFLSIQAGNSGAIYGHVGEPRNIGLRVQAAF